MRLHRGLLGSGHLGPTSEPLGGSETPALWPDVASSFTQASVAAGARTASPTVQAGAGSSLGLPRGGTQAEVGTQA